MFSFCAGIASPIATAPMPIAANRATRSSSFSDGFVLAITFAYRSCANDEAEVSVSPATTARMVAKATAAISASRIEPPSESAPPPTLRARTLAPPRVTSAWPGLRRRLR